LELAAQAARLDALVAGARLEPLAADGPGRLRALTLSYDLQIGDKFLKNATLYLTGNNLLTFTKYMGYDPEFSPGNAPAMHGIDTGLDPLFRSATLGIRMGL
jgi:hypothetical protein